MPRPTPLSRVTPLALPGRRQTLHKLLARQIRPWLPLTALIVLSISAYAAWRHYFPVIPADGWSVAVHADDLPGVSALALAPQGGLLISQTPTTHSGVIQTLHADGSITRHISGLAKPSGMLAYRNGIVFGQEAGTHPVTWWSGAHERLLFEGNGIEGLTSDGHYLYAIEDLRRNGRLLRYDPQKDVLEVLRNGLVQGEGLAACADGQLFYTLKGAGQVLAYSPDGQDRVVLDGLQSPGFLLCNRDGLWISEDTTHMARLLLLTRDGQLRTVLSHLRSAQTLLALPDERYLLAEQGRSRILLLSPKAPTAQP